MHSPFKSFSTTRLRLLDMVLHASGQPHDNGRKIGQARCATRSIGYASHLVLAFRESKSDFLITDGRQYIQRISSLSSLQNKHLLL